jgi:hypothetical protein
LGALIHALITDRTNSFGTCVASVVDEILTRMASTDTPFGWNVSGTILAVFGIELIELIEFSNAHYGQDCRGEAGNDDERNGEAGPGASAGNMVEI